MHMANMHTTIKPDFTLPVPTDPRALHTPEARRTRTRTLLLLLIVTIRPHSSSRRWVLLRIADGPRPRAIALRHVVVGNAPGRVQCRHAMLIIVANTTILGLFADTLLLIDWLLGSHCWGEFRFLAEFLAEEIEAYGNRDTNCCKTT
jgi:hypothetical protein